MLSRSVPRDMDTGKAGLFGLAKSNKLEPAIEIINSNTKSCTRILYAYDVMRNATRLKQPTKNYFIAFDY